MIYLLLLTNLIPLVLWWVDRRDHQEERKAWRLERVGLLNRIQAPEVETIKAFDVEEPQHLPYGDDRAWHEYEEKRREMSNGV